MNAGAALWIRIGALAIVAGVMFWWLHGRDPAPTLPLPEGGADVSAEPPQDVAPAATLVIEVGPGPERDIQVVLRAYTWYVAWPDADTPEDERAHLEATLDDVVRQVADRAAVLRDADERLEAVGIRMIGRPAGTPGAASPGGTSPGGTNPGGTTPALQGVTVCLLDALLEAGFDEVSMDLAPPPR